MEGVQGDVLSKKNILRVLHASVVKLKYAFEMI